MSPFYPTNAQNILSPEDAMRNRERILAQEQAMLAAMRPPPPPSFTPTSFLTPPPSTTATASYYSMPMERPPAPPPPSFSPAVGNRLSMLEQEGYFDGTDEERDNVGGSNDDDDNANENGEKTDTPK